MSPVGVLESSSDCRDWFSGEGSCKSRICNTSSCGAGSLQWVPTNYCQNMACIITSVFFCEEGVLPANILISKCLLPVDQGVVHVPVVILGDRDHLLRPKTFSGHLYMVSLLPLQSKIWMLY